MESEYEKELKRLKARITSLSSYCEDLGESQRELKLDFDKHQNVLAGLYIKKNYLEAQINSLIKES